jgi:ABC-type Mn2+/Zn2+ transport system permease subunit
MIAWLAEPFGYQYMVRAIWVGALVGAVCAFLSCYLILKGWALMGDALAHAVVPGVAVAYLACPMLPGRLRPDCWRHWRLPWSSASPSCARMR